MMLRYNLSWKTWPWGNKHELHLSKPTMTWSSEDQCCVGAALTEASSYPTSGSCIGDPEKGHCRVHGMGLPEWSCRRAKELFGCPIKAGYTDVPLNTCGTCRRENQKFQKWKPHRSHLHFPKRWVPVFSNIKTSLHKISVTPMNPTIMHQIHLNYQKLFPINYQAKSPRWKPVYPLMLTNLIIHRPEIMKKYNLMPSLMLTANHPIKIQSSANLTPITITQHHQHSRTCLVPFHTGVSMLHFQTQMKEKTAFLPQTWHMTIGRFAKVRLSAIMSSPE